MPGNKSVLLIAGFGSIGQRHLRNLLSLGCRDIVLYRSGKGFSSASDEYRIPVEHELKAALSYQPKAVIISNPTALHIPLALAAARAGCHLFIEKPVSHNLDGFGRLMREVKESKICVMVGFQFRFHPALRKIKQWLDLGIIGRVISATVHWGEYLPEWHLGEDYSKGYSARKRLGGGVINTLCHPFDYLRWLIGEVRGVYAMAGKLSSLKIDVEDTAEILLNFQGGAIGSVHLDYIERPSSHWIHIIADKGTIHWDNSDGMARIYSAKRAKWDIFSPPASFERNTMFLDEMRHFLNCLHRGENPLCTLNDGKRALEIALAVKESLSKKKEVTIQGFRGHPK